MNSYNQIIEHSSKTNAFDIKTKAFGNEAKYLIIKATLHKNYETEE
jgi:hypothetical protein